MPEPFEKTPGNWRLNYKDFKDVYETTFAKGTIVEFKKYQVSDEDDQVDQVEAMVTVKLEDGEGSDYLPLFFRPKENYWDGHDPKGPDGPGEPYVNRKATDYDEDQQTYLTAWMSFRPEDEVVVMLEKEESKRVICFYDGYPRPGESAFRIGDHYFHIPFIRNDGASQWLDVQTYIPNLPNTEDLGLKKEAEKFLTRNLPYGNTHFPVYSLQVDWDILCQTPPEQGYTIYQDGNGYRIDNYYKFTIGPYMYICVVIESKDSDVPDWHVTRHGYAGIACELIYSESFSYSGSSAGPPNFSAGLWVALYDKKKFDNIKIEYGDADTIDFPDFKYKSVSGFFFGEEDPGMVFVRPHTKEELQEAGMWADPPQPQSQSG